MASTMQLEFTQAMSDFKTMFPEMDRDVIEAVLRANQGAVDATIDQLLAMSTDNQNERLRHELEKSSTDSSHRLSTVTSIDSPDKPKPATAIDAKYKDRHGTALLSSSPGRTGTHSTGASPKIKKPVSATSSPISNVSNSTDVVVLKKLKRWDPPLLGPLPPTFLRITSPDVRNEFDLPDEQFAMMLQNEEFMNELRWNQEFMLALEKEQLGKGRTTEDDAAFKERLCHMGKKSRKKFLQLARVFTWQRNKKPGAIRHPDSLLLQEEHSDDDEPKRGCSKK